MSIFLGKRKEAADILCETNPHPEVKDLELGIELLIAHALQKECSEDERLTLVMKAQKLQSRLNSMTSAQAGEEVSSGLDLFMARIESCEAKKKTLLSRLMEQDNHILVRVLAGYEQYCHQSKPLEFIQDSIILVNHIDTIISMMHQDANQDMVRCELVFGVRRPFGRPSCISPGRKAIMDWMLESDTKVQNNAVMNNEGDFVIEPSLFKSKLSTYLLAVRKDLLVREAFRLRDKMKIESKPRHEQVQCLLQLIWLCIEDKESKGTEAKATDVERLEPGSLVQIQGLIEKRKGASNPAGVTLGSNTETRNGELATTQQRHKGANYKWRERDDPKTAESGTSKRHPFQEQPPQSLFGSRRIAGSCSFALAKDAASA